MTCDPAGHDRDITQSAAATALGLVRLTITHVCDGL